MPDYECELPLWNANWWELSLSTSLLDELADWQQAFDDGFRPEKGWRDALSAETWADDAKLLVGRLRSELDGRFDLEVDLWPLEGAS